MTKKLDTSWFDLKNYEALKTMSLEGWMQQIDIRRNCYLSELDRPEYSAYGYECDFDEHEESLLSTVIQLKSGVITDVPPYYAKWRDKKANAILLDRYTFSTASVNSLTSSDLLRLAKDNRLNTVWNACVNTWDIFSDDDPKCQEIADTPHDLNILEYSQCAYGESLAHVVINLLATDDQIKSDFNHWLMHYRKAMMTEHKRKLFTQSDIDYWTEYSVIPYIDLMLIAKIERKKIPTYNKLGQLLFPNEYDVDLAGRVRQVTKPAAELLLIKNDIHNALSIQLISEKATGMKK